MSAVASADFDDGDEFMAWLEFLDTLDSSEELDEQG